MIKSILLKVFLISLLVLIPLFSSPADAALGNYLYKWGGEYNYAFPCGIAIAPNGTVYSTSSGRIDLFTTTGTYITRWGTSPGAVLQGPYGAALDSDGNLYVTDNYYNMVMVFSSTGAFLRKWGGGTWGSADGQFNQPYGIAVGPNGSVYVADTGNNRIQVFKSDGTFITKWPVAAVPRSVAVDKYGNVYVTGDASKVEVFTGSGTPVTSWGSRGTGDGQFFNPGAIAVDADGDVYVADTYNSRVQVFNSAGKFLRKWGSSGSDNGQFIMPRGIAFDSDGNVYVTDITTSRVQVFTRSGEFIRKWAAYESGPGLFYYPERMAVDSNDNVYVADTQNHRIQVFSNSGSFLRVWGGRGTGDGQFDRARGIALDSSGNVYVADFNNNRIQVFSSDGTFIRKWGTTGSGDGQFRYPFGVAVDSSGNVFVTDLFNYRVQVFSSTGTFLRKWGSSGTGDGQFNYPSGIAVDSNGNVYVVDTSNRTVQVFSETGDFIRRVGSYGAHNGEFIYPVDVSVDRSGNLYVADYSNRVQVFSNTGASLGGWWSPDSGDGQLNLPFGLAVDSNGKIFVADTNNHRVQVFDGINKCVITADAGIDQTVEQTSPAGAYAALDGSGSKQQGCSGALTYSWSWSGGSATGPNPSVLTPPGTTEVLLTITSGSATSTDTVHITVRDTQKPATTSAIAGVKGASEWYISDVSVSLSATDSGSGVKEIRYSIDGTETVATGSTASFTVFAEGAHSITYFAKDNAGNSETAHAFTVKIDKSDPVISARVTPAANAKGWSNADVLIEFICADTVSGVASCSSPVTVSTEGAGQVVTGTSVDNAGRPASTSLTVNIDKTLPTVSLSATPGLLWPPNHKMVNVTINGSASDNGSNIASVVITVTDEMGVYNMTGLKFGSTIQLEAWREGTDLDGRTYTITAVITDNAGNQSTQTTMVVVPHDMR